AESKEAEAEFLSFEDPLQDKVRVIDYDIASFDHLEADGDGPPLIYKSEEEYQREISQEFEKKRLAEWEGYLRQQAQKVSSPKKKSTELLGKKIKGKPIPLKDVQDGRSTKIVLGEVFYLNQQNLRNGQTLYLFDIYDGTDSLGVKALVRPEQAEQRRRPIPQRLEDLKVGTWVKISGKVEYDRYDSDELVLMADAINEIEAPVKPRIDQAKIKRVELHAHTNMSSMDALPDARSLVKRAHDMGLEALAITDHGVLQAFPEAAAAAKEFGIKILYGCEIYLIDDLQDRRYHHCTVLAKNKKGLKELYRMTSKAHLENFYRRPRVLRQDLQEQREHLILGSACAYGEVYTSLLDSYKMNLQAAQDNAKAKAEFYDFLEVMPIGHNKFAIDKGLVDSLEDLEKLNKLIYEMGKELNIPVVATGDVHFLEPEDVIFRDILQAGQDYEADESKPLLHLRNTEEMLAEFSTWSEQEAYEVVVTNSNLIADQIEEIDPMPDRLYPPNLPGAAEELKEMTYQKAREMYGDPLPAIVLDRLVWELDCIIGYGHAVNYFAAHKLVKKSIDEGYPVGSRGSVGSSLVATLTGITEVNPLSAHYRCPACSYSDFSLGKDYDCGADMPDKLCPKCQEPLIKDGFNIRFEVFMGFAGDKIPDIDLNFSGEYQMQAHRHAEELFGKDYVYRAGTISTVANKTAYGFVMKYLEKTGAQLRRAEINRLTLGCTGVKRTTSQHPGGLMVVPADMDIHDFTAVQHPPGKDGAEVITTHFTYQAIHDHLMKLDLLGHDDPTILRKLQALTGVDISSIPLDDPETMKLFVSTEPLGVDSREIESETGTYGVPEFGTPFTRAMLMDAKPKYFSDLIRLSGFSHGTDVWAGNARELIVKYNIPLSEAISTRDAILIYLIEKGLPNSSAFQIMESVRRGRGLKEEEEALMRQHQVPEWYIDSCKKIKYLFPKAHAAAYVLSGYRIAWFKVHHPMAFYATYLSVRAGVNFDADLAAEGVNALRTEIARIKRKGNEATANERATLTHLEVALEATIRGVKFGRVELYRSEAKEWKIEEDKTLLPPFSALQGIGVNAAESVVAARNQGGLFTSIEDLVLRSKLNKTGIEILRIHGCLEGMNETDQLTLF
ncbi:MAG: PolC-type DNA polymerase III, partial [Firmicutes bacterium]|nr:PolC-type DNA polymerase III [Bacillota bacterium]